MNKYYVIFSAGVFISSLTQILLKKSAVRTYPEPSRRYLNPGVLSAYFILFGVTLLTAFAYRGIPLKAGPVLQSSGYIFIALLSRFFLGEKLSSVQWKGIFLIIVGIFVFHL